MTGATLAIAMFITLLVMLLLGYPVAFTLAGVALLFAFIGASCEVFLLSDLGFIPTRVWGIMGNFTLVAVPLFVFMGIVLERTGIAESLLEVSGRILQRLRGSLAIAVVLVGALLAASTGIVGATVVTMGVLSLPTMLRRGYSPEFATGTIAASGTLGQIIPPSIVLVLLGDMMNVDVGDLFLGAILPGLLLVVLYLAYVICLSQFRPQSGPHDFEDVGRPSLKTLATVFLPPVVLIVIVLGSIAGGIASPTEAAACGAFGALIIAASKRKLNFAMLKEVGTKTAEVTAMVFLILVGAQFFGVVFRGLGGDDLIADLVTNLPIHPSIALLFLMVLFFLLGFFLDFLEICFIVIPIVQPLLAGLGFDPLWVAVLIAVNLQTSFLTPPFGFALFYLKGVAPREVSTHHIYRGIVPFVIIQLVAIALVAFFPQLVLWFK